MGIHGCTKWALCLMASHQCRIGLGDGKGLAGAARAKGLWVRVNDINESIGKEIGKDAQLVKSLAKNHRNLDRACDFDMSGQIIAPYRCLQPHRVEFFQTPANADGMGDRETVVSLN